MLSLGLPSYDQKEAATLAHTAMCLCISNSLVITLIRLHSELCEVVDCQLWALALGIGPICILEWLGGEQVAAHL